MIASAMLHYTSLCLNICTWSQAGRTDTADARKGILLFKQRSGYALSKGAEVPKWQKDYHDHILRTEVEYRKHLNYLLMNPVKAGLAGSWREYPYWGSTIRSREEILAGFTKV